MVQASAETRWKTNSCTIFLEAGNGSLPMDKLQQSLNKETGARVRVTLSKPLARSRRIGLVDNYRVEEKKKRFCR